MARNKIKNWAINIDKLKVCYNITDDIYNYLASHYTKIEEKDDIKVRILEEDYFYLVFFDEEESKMSATLIIKDIENGDFKLGTFIFNCGKKYKNLAFFTFENIALYRVFTRDYKREPHGYISCLSYIADFYNMQFNNITTLELAFDSDFNFVKKIRKMIKDVEKYDMYLNGKKVEDNEEILQGYGEYYSRNRLKLQQPTLYFSQSKKSDMQMRVYDKKRELNESTPYKEEMYKKWLDWKKIDNIYRVEITLHNSNIRDFFSRYIRNMTEEMGGHDNVLSLIDNPDFRAMMFFDSIDRLIFFKEKNTKKHISIVELSGI